MSARPPSVLLLGDTLNVGGTERQFVEVACGLPRDRWSVHVSCLRAEGPLRDRLDAAGIVPWSSGPGSLRSPRVVPGILGLAREMRTRAISVFHSFDFYSNVFGIPAARLARVPAVIASQRDLGDLRPAGQQRLRALVLRLADRIVINSPAVAERLPSRLRPRVEIVPNGLDAERFASRSRRRTEPRSPLLLGTLANLRPEKGLDVLLRAVARLRQEHPAVTLTVWGDGPDRARLEALAPELGLARVISFPGRTDDVPAALAAIDAFVLPSLSEAASNALLEAMASGLPVVATDVGGNRIAVEDGRQGLLVPAGNDTVLAEALLRITQDPTAAARLGDAARARVIAEYSIPRMVERMEEAYRRTLAAPRHRRGLGRGTAS